MHFKSSNICFKFKPAQTIFENCWKDNVFFTQTFQTSTWTVLLAHNAPNCPKYVRGWFANGMKKNTIDGNQIVMHTYIHTAGVH